MGSQLIRMIFLTLSLSFSFLASATSSTLKVIYDVDDDNEVQSLLIRKKSPLKFDNIFRDREFTACYSGDIQTAERIVLTLAKNAKLIDKNGKSINATDENGNPLMSHFTIKKEGKKVKRLIVDAFHEYPNAETLLLQINIGKCISLLSPPLTVDHSMALKKYVKKRLAYAHRLALERYSSLETLYLNPKTLQCLGHASPLSLFKSLGVCLIHGKGKKANGKIDHSIYTIEVGQPLLAKEPRKWRVRKHQKLR